MARQAGLFQSELSRMERGLRRGTKDAVSALAETLRLDLQELLDAWLYVSDHVAAAILDSDLSDDAKRILLDHYDELRGEDDDAGG